MKTKYVITALALSLLAGVTSAFAQTNINTPVATYNALRLAQGNAWSPGGPEVLPIVEAIVAQPTITKAEARIVGDYYYKSEGQEKANAVFRDLADQSPYIAVCVKWQTKDSTGWTQEMMESDPRGVIGAVLQFPNPTPELKAFAFNYAMTTIPYDAYTKGFWKGQRRTLPKNEQLAVTQVQKDLLLGKTSRSDSDNAWLAEISADLIALQLDQQP